jgi:GrpB-like predicted nucleotidyltransferase (UPF0157 family)
MPGAVVVVPHDVRWREEFASESVLVARCLGENVVATHHIGSTSIPGIFAKPIIDILVEVADIATVDSCNEAMELAGYESMGEFGIPGRRYFPKDDANGVRSHQVHAFQSGDPEVARHLGFRNFMLSHPDIARKYSDLKRALALAHPEDIDAYIDGKDPFIKRVDKKAALWRRGA